MLQGEGRGTVRFMSIRATISGLLAGDGELSDPAGALEDAGYDNIPAEAFGTALTHFADTATLEEADALAPVVTLTGPVPFEEADLAEVEIDLESADAFSLFAHTVTTVHQDFGESELDELDDLDEETAPGSSLDGEDRLGGADEADFDFGEPSSQPESQDSSEESEPTPSFDESSSFGETETVEPIDAASDSASSDAAEPQSDDDLDEAFDDELDFDH